MKVLASLLAAAHGQYNSAYDDWGQNSTDYYDYESGRMSTAIFYPNIAATIDELAMPPIKCWTCKNARNGRECRRDGYVQQCESNEQVCEIEVRKRNGKRVESVSTGCKWRRACLDNKRQNFINANKWQHQCRPGFWHHLFNKGPSVCRQCCDGKTDEECGIKFVEEYKGKAPPQKPRWREKLLPIENECTIDGQEAKVIVTTVTSNENGANTNRQQEFKIVSNKPDCNFDWVIMDNPDLNDFEKGAIDVFEFAASDVHINPHCFQDIKEILFTDGKCMGSNASNCNAWKAQSIDVSIKNVDACETTTIDFDVPFTVDEDETALKITEQNTNVEDHWILK